MVWGGPGHLGSQGTTDFVYIETQVLKEGDHTCKSDRKKESEPGTQPLPTISLGEEKKNWTSKCFKLEKKKATPGSFQTKTRGIIALGEGRGRLPALPTDSLGDSKGGKIP